MSTPINTLGLVPSGISGATVGSGTSGAAGAAGGGGDFSNTLKDLLGKVDDSSEAANDAVSKMVDGTGDVHEAMIALQRADMMLQMTVQIRNKLVQAYQDVMRMPV
ncbi:MAG: flagellar hook-basal body complex protein FliE [Acidobacteriota bacterium]